MDRWGALSAPKISYKRAVAPSLEILKRQSWKCGFSVESGNSIKLVFLALSIDFLTLSWRLKAARYPMSFGVVSGSGLAFQPVVFSCASGADLLFLNPSRRHASFRLFPLFRRHLPMSISMYNDAFHFPSCRLLFPSLCLRFRARKIIFSMDLPINKCISRCIYFSWDFLVSSVGPLRNHL